MNRVSATWRRLKESNMLLRVLLDDLLEALNAPADSLQAETVLALLQSLLENLDEQFRHEEHRDYLAEVLERYPSWHPHVRQLQEEQRLLERHLREIYDRAATEHAGGALSAECRRQIRDWMDAYQHHDRRETELLQEAFTLEVGVGE